MAVQEVVNSAADEDRAGSEGLPDGAGSELRLIREIEVTRKETEEVKAGARSLELKIMQEIVETKAGIADTQSQIAETQAQTKALELKVTKEIAETQVELANTRAEVSREIARVAD